jgi:hypothetical protein
MNITEMIAELADIRKHVGDIQVAMPGGFTGSPIPIGGVGVSVEGLWFLAIMQTREEAKNEKNT